MSNTPHVTLTGFGYLEPLARPIRTVNSMAPPKGWDVPPLSPREQRLTSRLATRSNWLRQDPAELTDSSTTKLRRRSFKGGNDLLDSMNSQYSTTGIWPADTPPKPTVAREKESTALQRRVATATSKWHAPPQPEHAARPEDEEEPFTWRKRWDRVAVKDVRDGEWQTDKLERVGSSL